MPSATTKPRTKTASTRSSSAARRRSELAWLKEVTAIPTAAGHEHRVIAWIERWVKARRHLTIDRDAAGNLFIRPKAAPRSKKSAPAPILVTAHLDHPAFVVLSEPRRGVLGELGFELDVASTSVAAVPVATEAGRRRGGPHPVSTASITSPPSPTPIPPKVLARRGTFVLCEFRGGVHRPYFEEAAVEVIDAKNRRHAGTIVAVSDHASPHRRVIVELAGGSPAVLPGDLARWRFDGRLPRIEDGLLFTHACDDLAAVAAALALLDRTSRRQELAHVGLLFTRAEEIGFIGAIAAARSKSIERSARLLCLENSRSFAESPIGGGPIVRVGDRISVFSPDLTNIVSQAATAHAADEAKAGRTFKWQRKLMAGGACEATAFAAYGYASTCLCLPLGHYHNMSRIDEAVSGERPAKVAPEFISIEDYHGLIDLLEAVVSRLDAPDAAGRNRPLMEKLFAERRTVLE
jgi:putative aminopeptidase FrvX